MIVGTIAASADQSAFARTHQSIHQKNKSSQSQECHANGGSGVGVGSGLLAGIGAGIGGTGGTNLCANSNPQTNVNLGSNGNE